MKSSLENIFSWKIQSIRIPSDVPDITPAIIDKINREKQKKEEDDRPRIRLPIEDEYYRIPEDKGKNPYSPNVDYTVVKIEF